MLLSCCSTSPVAPCGPLVNIFVAPHADIAFGCTSAKVTRPLGDARVSRSAPSYEGLTSLSLGSIDSIHLDYHYGSWRRDSLAGDHLVSLRLSCPSLYLHLTQYFTPPCAAQETPGEYVHVRTLAHTARLTPPQTNSFLLTAVTSRLEDVATATTGAPLISQSTTAAVHEGMAGGPAQASSAAAPAPAASAPAQTQSPAVKAYKDDIVEGALGEFVQQSSGLGEIVSGHVSRPLSRQSSRALTLGLPFAGPTRRIPLLRPALLPRPRLAVAQAYLPARAPQGARAAAARARPRRRVQGRAGAHQGRARARQPPQRRRRGRRRVWMGRGRARPGAVCWRDEGLGPVLHESRVKRVQGDVSVAEGYRVWW